MVDKAGWKRDLRQFKNLYSWNTRKTYDSLESIRSAFLDASTGDELKLVGIASWQNDLEEIEINLERKRYHEPTPADLRKETTYLISITISYSVVPHPGWPALSAAFHSKENTDGLQQVLTYIRRAKTLSNVSSGPSASSMPATNAAPNPHPQRRGRARPNQHL